MEKLEGQELVSKFNQLRTEGMSDQGDLARALGWVSGKRTNANGMLAEIARLQFGVEVKSGLRGKVKSYEVSVQKNQTVILGKAYTSELNWISGNPVTFKMDPANDSIIVSRKK